MSLALIAQLASMAVELGPTVIRGVSNLFGGSDTANEVADAVESLGPITSANKNEKELQMAATLGSMPPEKLVELERLKVELQKETTRRQQLTYEDEQQSHLQTQSTIREGDNAADEYVRHTRPKMARQSWMVTALYVLVFSLMEALGKGTGPSLDIALMLLSPAWAYLGLRTLDGFAPHSKASGDKVMSVIGGVLKGRK